MLYNFFFFFSNLIFRQLLNNFERNIHRLVIHENNVKKAQILFEPLLDLEVEEPDLENDVGVFETVTHVQVADAVAHQNDVVARL